MHNVFAYGTLMFPEVMKALVGEVPPCSSVTLHGYARVTLPIREYHPIPIIVPIEGHSVSGVLYTGLPDKMIASLDDFEEVGSEGWYRRVAEEVELASGEVISAECYVSAKASDKVLLKDWCPEHFREKYLNSYVAGVMQEDLPR